ncbi:hypothetical protein HCG97_19035 [Klebsiella aerogenes]|uniref:hypothetical protein n=1 Tax=Klebsiella aerogenes TaxID=548 RepID=UPI001C8C53FE|nr:hypothetical protein [Klebsiella aerogenes]MBX9066236.1 hypothetical protein [Klebsiella aerogenes]
MTDITRLLASLKRRSAHVKEFGDDITFIKLEDLDALVEALEKAQQRNGELETYSKTAIEFREAARDENRHLKLELEIAEKRIAELESRTVTVKQFDEFQICHYGATEDYAKGYIDCQNNFFKWLTAAGIKWEAE